MAIGANPRAGIELIMAEFAGCLGLLGAVMIVGNYYLIFLGRLFKKNTSMVPFVGGVFLSTALAIAYGKTIGWWCLLPIVADPGCLPLLVLAMVAVARRDNRG